MAYTETPWGYDVDGELPPLIDAYEFAAIKGSKWEGDERLDGAIASANAAIRSYCGWHVYPSMPCRAVIDASGTASVWLPTTHLTSVNSLSVSGAEVDGYQWSRIGQLLPSVRVPRGLQAAEVEYVAGYSAVPADLAEAVADVVLRRIALSYGVTSERAGDVSISYGGSAVYGGGSASLTDSERAALMPYRVVMAHAT